MDVTVQQFNNSTVTIGNKGILVILHKKTNAGPFNFSGIWGFQFGKDTRPSNSFCVWFIPLDRFYISLHLRKPSKTLRREKTFAVKKPSPWISLCRFASQSSAICVNQYRRLPCSSREACCIPDLLHSRAPFALFLFENCFESKTSLWKAKQVCFIKLC